jgi:hypothetical protein
VFTPRMSPVYQVLHTQVQAELYHGFGNHRVYHRIKVTLVARTEKARATLARLRYFVSLSVVVRVDLSCLKSAVRIICFGWKDRVVISQRKPEPVNGI